jgi:MFS transporter, DHA2 family, multidrug resistance protein
MLPVDLLAKRLFAFSTLGALAAYIAWMLMFVSVPFRLQHQNGFSPGEVGSAIAAWPIAMVIVAPIAGRLSDRHSAAWLSGIGMALTSAALIALAFFSPDADVWDAAMHLAVCGVGFALFISPNARMIISSAPVDRAASAGGLVFTTRLIGYTLGATLAAALLSMGLGAGPAVPIVAAFLTLAAGALFLCLRRTSQSFEG